MRRDHNFPVSRGPRRLWLWAGLAGLVIIGAAAMYDGGGSAPRAQDPDRQALLGQMSAMQGEMRKLDSRIGELELQVDTLKRSSSYETLDGTQLPVVPDPLDGPAGGLPVPARP